MIHETFDVVTGEIITKVEAIDWSYLEEKYNKKRKKHKPINLFWGVRAQARKNLDNTFTIFYNDLDILTVYPSYKGFRKYTILNPPEDCRFQDWTFMSRVREFINLKVTSTWGTWFLSIKNKHVKLPIDIYVKDDKRTRYPKYMVYKGTDSKPVMTSIELDVWAGEKEIEWRENRPVQRNTKKVYSLDNNWEICQLNRYDVKYHIVHRCSENKRGYATIGSRVKKCPVCKEFAPNSVYMACKLHSLSIG